jgi:hypothetical protein
VITDQSHLSHPTFRTQDDDFGSRVSPLEAKEALRRHCGPGGVDGRCQAGRPTTDDDDLARFGHRLSRLGVLQHKTYPLAGTYADSEHSVAELAQS